MRIDAHLHVWEKEYPNRPYPWTPDPFTAEDLLPLLDDNGIDMAVHVSPVMVGWDNSYGNKVAERYPDRFRVFGRFDPVQPDVEKALESWLESPGAAGVRLTAFRRTESGRLDDKAMRPFWAAASDTGAMVAVFAPGRLDELKQVMKTNPRIRLIIDHFGLGVHADSEDPFAGVDELAAFAESPNVFLKVSAMPEVSSEPFPYPDLHPHLKWAIREFGAHRLIWGSNWPVEAKACTYREAYRWINESGLATETEANLILGGTMQQLLGLPDRRPEKGD